MELEQAIAGPVTKDRMGYWHKTESRNLLVTPMVSEEMLASAYLRFHQDKLLDRIFSEGPASLSWFLRHYTREEICVLACLREDPVTKKFDPCGLGWIVNRTPVGPPNNPTFYKAEVGEAFYRHVSPRDTVWFGRMMIDYAMENLGIEALYGVTPAPNVPGVRYAHLLEFEVFGPLGNYTAWVDHKTGQRTPCAAHISAMTKQKWEHRSWR